MMKRISSACVAALLLGQAVAQTVTTSGGTSGKIPVYTGTSTVGNSNISVLGAQVSVDGFVSAESGAGGIFFKAHQLGAGYGNNLAMFSAETDNPNGLSNYYFQGLLSGNRNFAIRADGMGSFHSLEVHGDALGQNVGDSQTLMLLQSANLNNNQLIFSQKRYTTGTNWDTATTRIGERTDITDQGYIEFNPSNGQYGLAFGSGSSEFMRLISGNLGIGTSSPTGKLEVNGNLKLTLGSGASMTYPDNTVQSTAWNGTTCGGDYAESVDVTGERKSYEPGDVLVIDTKVEGSFVKSWEPYSTAVMGIYSTKPGLTGRRQLTPKSEEEIPMAMIGIVPTKVTTENGPIRPGDLLVTSSTPGYAMRGTDRLKMLGAVIGKAMGHLDAGKGVIEAGVTLQ